MSGLRMQRYEKLILITGILLSTNAWADMKPLLDCLDDEIM